MTHAETALDVAVIGYGKMGRALEEAATRRGHRVVARIDSDPAAGADATHIGTTTLAGARVAFEFTTPEEAPRNCAALFDLGVAVVSGTTGWNEELDFARAQAKARGASFLHAPNYSLGMQIVFRIAERAAAWLSAAGEFEPYLIEEHHAAKHDAPSGTAKRLAEILVARTAGKIDYGVAPADGAIPADLVPVAWVRAGAIPGTHLLGWDGPGETVELVHRVRDRGVFAAGAVAAAEWLVAHPGVHTLDDMIDALVATSGFGGKHHE